MNDELRAGLIAERRELAQRIEAIDVLLGGPTEEERLAAASKVPPRVAGRRVQYDWIMGERMYFEGRPTKEVANALDCTPRTMRGRRDTHRWLRRSELPTEFQNLTFEEYLDRKEALWRSLDPAESEVPAQTAQGKLAAATSQQRYPKNDRKAKAMELWLTNNPNRSMTAALAAIAAVVQATPTTVRNWSKVDDWPPIGSMYQRGRHRNQEPPALA